MNGEYKFEELIEFIDFTGKLQEFGLILFFFWENFLSCWIRLIPVQIESNTNNIVQIRTVISFEGTFRIKCRLLVCHQMAGLFQIDQA